MTSARFNTRPDSIFQQKSRRLVTDEHTVIWVHEQHSVFLTSVTSMLATSLKLAIHFAFLLDIGYG